MTNIIPAKRIIQLALWKNHRYNKLTEPGIGNLVRSVHFFTRRD
jgi:hypothetical protein